jgi:hypothetical protein
VNPRVWVAVAVAVEVPAVEEELLFEDEDVVVIRVELYLPRNSSHIRSFL